MVLTESVRDAADLYLSLKYPPVTFVCDTPCTLVRHLDIRVPEMANKIWGEFDGCFEEPKIGQLPSQVSDFKFPKLNCRCCSKFGGSYVNFLPYFEYLTI